MFELILGLEQDGWVLQPLQAGQRPSRGELRYVLGDDTARKVFYIREGPAPLCRAYFMALSSLQSIQQRGYPAIAHLRPAKYYTEMLSSPYVKPADPMSLCLADGESLQVVFRDSHGCMGQVPLEDEGGRGRGRARRRGRQFGGPHDGSVRCRVKVGGRGRGLGRRLQRQVARERLPLLAAFLVVGYQPPPVNMRPEALPVVVFAPFAFGVPPGQSGR